MQCSYDLAYLELVIKRDNSFDHFLSAAVKLGERVECVKSVTTAAGNRRYVTPPGLSAREE